MNDYATRPFIVLMLSISLTLALDFAAGSPAGPLAAAQAEQTAPRVGQTTAYAYPQAVDNKALTPKKVKQIAHIAVTNWFDEQQWNCYANIIHVESRWKLDAQNPTSTAWGIGQILDSKDNTGLDPYKQIITALNYMIHKYGTPCKAWTFHKKHRWY